MYSISCNEQSSIFWLQKVFFYYILRVITFGYASVQKYLTSLEIQLLLLNIYLYFQTIVTQTKSTQYHKKCIVDANVGYFVYLYITNISKPCY